MGKSYNPFKMWGSYVGMFLISFTQFLNMISDKFPGIITTPASFIFGSLMSEFDNLFPFGGDIIEIILTWILGFFIGWGIHSLFRRFSK